MGSCSSCCLVLLKQRPGTRSALSGSPSNADSKFWASQDNLFEQQTAELMEVAVRALSGNEIARVQLAPTQHISLVKQRVQAACGVWADEQRLVWKDEILPDDRPLAACGLHKGSHLTLIHTPVPFVLAGRTDGLLTLWDLRKNDVVEHLPRAHSSRILCLVVDWPSRQAMSGGGDKTFMIWDLASSTPVHLCCGLPSSMHAAAVDWESHTVLAGFGDGSVASFELDLPHGNELQRFFGSHKGCVTSLEADWSARRALTASYDRTLILWDLDAGKALRSLEGHRGVIMSAALGWSSGLALSGAADAAVILWDLSSGSIASDLRGHGGTVRDLAVDWSRCRALSASSDKTIGLWSFERIEEEQPRNTPEPFPWEEQSQEEQTQRAVVTTKTRATGRLVSMFRGHTGQVNKIRADWTSLIAISVADDGLLLIWSLEDCSVLRSLWLLGNAEVTAMNIKWDAFEKDFLVQEEDGQSAGEEQQRFLLL